MGPPLTRTSRTGGALRGRGRPGPRAAAQLREAMLAAIRASYGLQWALPTALLAGMRAAASQSKLALEMIEENHMAASVKQMLEAANAVVPKITPDQAAEMIKKGNTLVLDVRDAPEVATSGKIAGAVNVSRGMLEFRADPESPYHDKNFDKDKSVILYCASGGRSALAGKQLKDMGYDKVYNVGGFKDWTGPVDKT